MKQRGSTATAALALVGLLTLGCAGDGSELAVMTGPSGPEPTLAWIQANILTPRCTECHVPGGIGVMPMHTEQVSYNNLVNVYSVEINTLFRVEPFEPDNSYMVWKIEGRAGIVGDQMPLGRPPLDPEEIALIREWIRLGAEP
ncbi:MAG: hypothetical protein R3344_09370 [Acidobacteriota bacterium]|nr:hypothetical protein [Acidobacteriota bacterium]